MNAAEVLAEPAHCIVANPPYIVEPDTAKRELHRARYTSAHAKYGLGVVFTERMFQLCAPGGFIGQITSNAFMKREYGRALVEEVLPRYDLFAVVDTAGAFIPGHGTPTCLLFARKSPPREAGVIGVLGKRGEPATPADPAQGVVWNSIRCGLGFGPETTPYCTHGETIARQLAPVLPRAAEELGGGRNPERWLVSVLCVLAAADRYSDHRGTKRCASLREATELVREHTPDWASGPLNHELTPSQALEAQLSKILDKMPGAILSNPDTDWLGDAYQHLNAWAVRGLALVQTPRFVRTLILDVTLTAALLEFGLDGIRVLDPACGPGHFLVDAFWRIYQLHADPPDGPPEVTTIRAAELALAAVRGVDLNAEVVDLARFRLWLAYHDAAFTRSCQAPTAPLVAAGDSLLEGPAARKIKPTKEGKKPQKQPHEPQGNLFSLGGSK